MDVLTSTKLGLKIFPIGRSMLHLCIMHLAQHLPAASCAREMSALRLGVATTCMMEGWGRVVYQHGNFALPGTEEESRGRVT